MTVIRLTRAMHLIRVMPLRLQMPLTPSDTGTVTTLDDIRGWTYEVMCHAPRLPCLNLGRPTQMEVQEVCPTLWGAPTGRGSFQPQGRMGEPSKVAGSVTSKPPDALGVKIIGIGEGDLDTIDNWVEEESFGYEVWRDDGRALAIAHGAISSPSQGAYSHHRTSFRGGWLTPRELQRRYLRL